MAAVVPDYFAGVACSACFGVFNRENAGSFFVGDVDCFDGCVEDVLIRVGEEKDGFRRVVDEFGGEAGMVFGEMDDGVFAGNVGCGDDGELRPVDGRIVDDGGDATARDGGADCGSIPHAGKSDVVHILGAARDFG